MSVARLADTGLPFNRKETWGANTEAKLTGAELHERHHAGSLTTPWMGRQGGLDGAELTNDIASGTWRSQRYECSAKAVSNRNWFTVAAFVARIDSTPAVAPPASPSSPADLESEARPRKGGR